jgi:glycosyltransferase involved in cell wall biosynthesis
LSEVIEHGVTGYLHAPEDLDGMAQSIVRLVADDALHDRMASAAAGSARDRYCDSRIVPEYEAFYQEVITKPSRL